MKWLKEPLLHFILIGLGLFVLYAWLNPEEMNSDDSIVVSAGQVESLSANFSRTWNRPPTQEELQNLVDGFIIEEIYYRQALDMGLDRDDPVVRRRLRQKMEFITADVSETLEPTETELVRYLEVNADSFRQDPVFSFEQHYFPSATEAESLETIKARLSEGGAIDAPQTLLPAAMNDATSFAVDRQFGEGFADKLAQLPLNQWSGPINSGFGRHLVRISAFTPGYHPQLAEVRRAVEREWQTEQNLKLKERLLDTLLAEYEVTVEWPSATRAAEGSSS